MYTIQLELRDELAEKLAPYHDRLIELLELGLQEWLEREQQEHIRHTPVPITGKPVSELLIEQRGPL